MDVEILSKKENKLLGRTEVEFRAVHPKEKTPTRDEVRQALAKALRAEKGTVIVDEMRTEFGKAEARGYAKLYPGVEAAKEIEPLHLQARNKLPGVEAKAKAGPRTAPSKAEAKPEAARPAKKGA